VSRSPVTPALAVLAFLYLMTKLPLTTWIRFGVWLAIGLVLYFSMASDARSFEWTALSRPRQSTRAMPPGESLGCAPLAWFQRERDRARGDGVAE
jgi:hypothetical protein